MPRSDLKEKFTTQGRFKAICPECGHDWLKEVRSYGDCPACVGYLMQARHLPDVHQAIRRQSVDDTCHLCGEPLLLPGIGVRRDNLVFCCLECCGDYKALECGGW